MQQLLRDRRVITHAVDILVLLNPSTTAADATEADHRPGRPFAGLPVTQVAAELITEHTPRLPRPEWSTPDAG